MNTNEHKFLEAFVGDEVTRLYMDFNPAKRFRFIEPRYLDCYAKPPARARFGA
jgi:hypothetical protein